jgi:hypothetical protein
MVIVLSALFVLQGHFNPRRLPTISYSAIYFPGTRIIAVGLGIVSISTVFLFHLIGDYFAVHQKLIGHLVKLLSLFCAILFVVTGAINFGEKPRAHSLFALAAFSCLVVLNLITLIGEIQIGNAKHRGLKLLCFILGFVSVFGMMESVKRREHDFWCSMIAVFEHVIVLTATVAIIFYKYEFSQLKIALQFDLGPRSGANSPRATHAKLQ